MFSHLLTIHCICNYALLFITRNVYLFFLLFLITLACGLSRSVFLKSQLVALQIFSVALLYPFHVSLISAFIFFISFPLVISFLRVCSFCCFRDYLSCTRGSLMLVLWPVQWPQEAHAFCDWPFLDLSEHRFPGSVSLRVRVRYPRQHPGNKCALPGSLITKIL